MIYFTNVSFFIHHVSVQEDKSSSGIIYLNPFLECNSARYFMTKKPLQIFEVVSEQEYNDISLLKYAY